MAKGKFNENKAKPWNGKDLKGTWQVTLKLDGARMLRDEDGNPVSRSGKPLYNLNHIDKGITDAEVYNKDWETSMGLVRSSVNGSPVSPNFIYSLSPLDSRLDLGYLDHPTDALIMALMRDKVKAGYEGLILRQGDKWLKVKPKDTCDILVTGFQPGTGKHSGRMGALLTDYGKVGTGFSDADREAWQALCLQDRAVGSLIEVEFMEWTKNGIMRHPRFVRIRDDKTEVSLGESYASMFKV